VAPLVHASRRLARFGPLAAGLVAGAAALAVSLPHIGDALSQDEVASARILGSPTFGAMLSRVARTESTPPLWYVLGWAAHQAGLSIAGVRLLSTLFAVLLAAAVVAVARELLPLRFAVAAGLLVAVGAQFAWHGHQLRAYELFALLTVLLAVSLVRSLRAPSRRHDLYLVAVVAAGLLTHYFFVFTVVAALGWVWLEPHAGPIRRRSTVAIGAGALLCAPWLPLFVEQFRHDRFWWIGPFRLHGAVAAPFRLFTPLVAQGVAGRVIPFTFLALTVCGAVALARRSPAGRLCALLAFGPLVLASGAWAAGFRIFAARNLMGIGPFAAMAAVGAVSLLPRRAGAVVLAGGVAAVVASFAINQRIPAPPYQLVAQALVREGWHPRDPVAVFGDFFDVRAPLEWYLPHQPVLAVSRGTKRPCETVFAVAGPVGARRLRHVLYGTRVGGFVVARLDLDHQIRGSDLQRATILVDPKRRPSCLSLVNNPRLAPIV
jgi:4-amino-4-deoxy-L-arabinose transferase-like glycosyltransferase